jgi:hypothetical protein
MADLALRQSSTCALHGAPLLPSMRRAPERLHTRKRVPGFARESCFRPKAQNPVFSKAFLPNMIMARTGGPFRSEHRGSIGDTAAEDERCRASDCVARCAGLRGWAERDHNRFASCHGLGGKGAWFALKKHRANRSVPAWGGCWVNAVALESGESGASGRATPEFGLSKSCSLGSRSLRGVVLGLRCSTGIPPVAGCAEKTVRAADSYYYIG